MIILLLITQFKVLTTLYLFSVNLSIYYSTGLKFYVKNWLWVQFGDSDHIVGLFLWLVNTCFGVWASCFFHSLWFYSWNFSLVSVLKIVCKKFFCRNSSFSVNKKQNYNGVDKITHILTHQLSLETIYHYKGFEFETDVFTIKK